MGRNAPSQRSVELRCGRPRRFSDSFRAKFGEHPSPLKNVREAVWISDDCCPGGVGRLPERSVSEAAGPRPAPSSSVPCARNRAAALCSVPWRSAAPLRSPARAS